MTTPIYLPGVAGRMGQAIAEALAQTSDLQLAAAFEAPGHPWQGKSLAQVLPAAASDCIVAETPPDAPPERAVTGIHFTYPEPTMAWLQWSVKNTCPMVIATTGFTDEQVVEIQKAAESIPIVMAPNMSVGVNLLFALTKRAADTIGQDFDIEIVEMHHGLKKDAPSGTAKRLGEIACESTGLDYNKDIAHGRQGMIGERPKREIGMHALRGGGVVGEHTVVFASQVERIELTHRAANRGVFADGALRAVRYLQDKTTGLHDMQDVLGLK